MGCRFFMMNRPCCGNSPIISIPDNNYILGTEYAVHNVGMCRGKKCQLVRSTLADCAPNRFGGRFHVLINSCHPLTYPWCIFLYVYTDFNRTKSIVHRLEHIVARIFNVRRGCASCRSTVAFVLSARQTENLYNAMEIEHGCCTVRCCITA